MKKFTVLIYFLLLAVSNSVAQSFYQEIKIIKSDETGISFKFTTPEFRKKVINQNNKIYTKIIFDNFEYTKETGKPELPFRTVLIALPPTGDYAINIASKSTETLDDIVIPPSPKLKGYTDGFPQFSLEENSEIYKSKRLIKDNFISEGEVSIIKKNRILKFKIFPVKFIPASKQLIILKNIVINITFSGKTTIHKPKYEKLRGEFLSVLNREYIPYFKLDTEKRPKVKKQGFSGRWYKIPIIEEGIYRIDKNWIEDNRIDVQSNNPKNIKIYNNGGYNLPSGLDSPLHTEFNENHIYVHGEADNSFDESDYILFYARGPEGWKWNEDYTNINYYINSYNKKNIYWLNIGSSGKGKRMSQNTITDNQSVNIYSYTDRYHYEEEKFNIFGSGLEWLSTEFTPSSFSKKYNFNVSDFSENGEAKLKIRLKGGSENVHSFKIDINNQHLLNTGNFSHFSNFKIEENIQDKIVNGDNEISIMCTSEKEGAISYLDWFEIHYKRELKCKDNVLKFESPIGFSGKAKFNLVGFTQPSNVMILDITRYDSVNILNFQIKDGIINFTDIIDKNVVKTYLAMDKGKIKPSPEPKQVTFSNLKEIQNGFEYVIIAYDEFSEACIPLKELRQSCPDEPLTTEIFKISDIYNEFSFGMVDPIAIRNFMRYAIINWDTKPKYLLLVGDGHFDFKNNLGGSPPVYIPPFEIDGNSYISSRATDDWFTYLSGDDFDMDISVGRLTSNSKSETESIINKIVKYETEPEFGIWKSTVTLTADDEFGNQGFNNEDIHTIESEELATKYLPDFLNINKIYLMEYEGEQSSSSFHLEKPEAADDLIETINNGTLVINFFGHGTPTRWAHEKLLIYERDFSKIRNESRLPLWVVATCDFGHYDTPEFQSMSEELLSKNNGGGIAILSTNRAVYADPNAVFTKILFKYLFNETGTCIRIGDAVKQAKNSTSNLTNNQKFHIFGDPTLKLAVPEHKPENITLSPDTLKALGKSKVDATIQSILYGTSEIKVFDSKYKKVHTMPNGENVSYILNGNILFNGVSDISNGKLTSTFIVPKDITYGGTDGRVNVYFFDEESDGTGYIDNICIGGTATVEDDKKGPQISISYKNEPFYPGSFAKKGDMLKIILYDENGINLTGEIGHSITAILDNSLDNTKVLNKYFSYEKNSYTKGNTYLQLDDISVGFHTISIKTWDNFNNSSVYSLDFEIVDESKLTIKEAYNYPNPFQNDTYFTFRLSSPSEISIKIYTQFGRLIKNIEGIFGNNGFNKVYWNGMDEDGDRLANGVYLYKIIAKDLNSGERTENIGKLVVMK